MWKLLRGQRFNPDDSEIIRLIETIHKSFQIIDMSGGILNHLPFVRYIMPDLSGLPYIQDYFKSKP